MEPGQTPRRRRSDMYHAQESAPVPAYPPLQSASSAPAETQFRQVQPMNIPQANIPQPVRQRRAQPAPVQQQSTPTVPPAPVPQASMRMERPPKPVPAQAPAKAPAKPLPKWLTASLIASMFTVVLLLTAGWLMQGYLRDQQEARDTAHQALLNNHPLSYSDLIDKYAAENNLQPAYVAAIILNESSYRTNAESNVGARGLMQVMEDTAEWIADKLDIENYSFDMLWDAETNIRFGCWYLGWLSKLFGGDPVAVTAAYHAGQGQVSSWLADSSISPDGKTLQVDLMPEGNTKIYAGRVTQAYAIYDALYYHALNKLPADIDNADVSGSDSTGN